MKIERVDALEAGISFMAWVFSEGHAFSSDVMKFTNRIGLDWSEFKSSLGNEGGTSDMIERIRRATAPISGHAFAWFEVGRNAILLANLIGTGAPRELVKPALAGYHKYLEDARIRYDDRQGLQNVLLSMAAGNAEEKEDALRDLQARLRNLALTQEEGEAAMVHNTITLHFDNGSTFTGNIYAAQNIQVAYSASANAATNALKGELEEVVRLASQLIESIESPEQQEDVSAQLKTFTEEAAKDRPNRWMLDVSSQGLIEAAKTVAALAAPITTAVRAVMELLAPTA